MDTVNQTHKHTQMIVEAGLAIALAFVLHLIIIFQMPQGGSIKAANLVPLLFFAYRWGAKKGLLVGAIYGLVQFLLGMKFSIHPASIFLDYILSYAMMGVAGWFSGSTGKALFGAIVACFLQWCCSVISGAVVFASYAPVGQNPWLYSMVYNGMYMLPNAIINLVVVGLFYGKIMGIMNKSAS